MLESGTISIWFYGSGHSLEKNTEESEWLSRNLTSEIISCWNNHIQQQGLMGYFNDPFYTTDPYQSAFGTL